MASLGGYSACSDDMPRVFFAIGVLVVRARVIHLSFWAIL